MNTKSNLQITVVVAAYNRAELTKQCLMAIAGQTLSTDLFEVLVVNNNSTDNTEQMVTEFIVDKSNFRLINEKMQGLSAVRNRGWKEGKGQYVVFIDNDIMPQPDLLEKVLSAFDSIRPSPLVIGSKIMPSFSSKPAKWWSDDFEIRSWGEHARFLTSAEAWEGFSGGCCTFKKDILEALNGFSTTLGMNGEKLRGGEETDLFNRIHAMNDDNDHSLWYDPEILVYHWVPKAHLSFFYHLKRSYGFGVSTRENAKVKRHLLKYLLGLLAPFYYFIPEMINIKNLHDYQWMTRLVIASKNIAWKAGYYWARG